MKRGFNWLLGRRLPRTVTFSHLHQQKTQQKCGALCNEQPRYYIDTDFNSYRQKLRLAYRVPGLQLPSKLDSAWASGARVCRRLAEVMTLIGKKMLHKGRQRLIIRPLYLFSARSHYAKRPFQ